MIVLGESKVIIAGAGLFVIWREHQLALQVPTSAEEIMPASSGAATTPLKALKVMMVRVSAAPRDGLHLPGR